VATNGTKAGVEVSPRLELTSTRILSPMSRMIPMPRCICSRDLCLTLPAGKSRTVKIETKTALTAKSTLRVGIALGKKRAPIGDVTALVRPKKVEKPVEKTGDVAQKK
jgi:hypothetical protein